MATHPSNPPWNLSGAELDRWLWAEMDPWADMLVTHDGIEIIAAHRRSAGRCGVCGDPVDLDVPRGRLQPTLDHIVPLSKGGNTERVNLQLAHRGCNSRKGNQ
jgi:5-methylcytosine-specific restriction endonuclease McrA